MAFEARPVTAAVATLADLYEPSVTVAPDGAVYVAAHTPGAFATRAPAWVSLDDGRSWTGLPGHAPGSSALPGGGEPSGDESLVAVDADGHAWMFENGLGVMPLWGWCDRGATLCSYNPNAWPGPVDAADPTCPQTPLAGGAAAPASQDDRPWVHYGHGQLLLQNNAALNAQVGLVDVRSGTARWNLCLEQGNQSTVAGPGALRDSDGTLLVPHLQPASGGLDVMAYVGTDVQALRRVDTGLHAAGSGNCLSPAYGNLGFAAVTANGTFVVAAGTTQTTIGLAVSDDGVSFRNATFPAGGPIGALWVAASQRGDGALVSWLTEASPSCTANRDGPFTLHAAHVAWPAGRPMLEDSTDVAVVAHPCGDLLGSALGPDGRAYLASYDRPKCGETPDAVASIGKSPLTVYVQTAGPRV